MASSSLAASQRRLGILVSHVESDLVASSAQKAQIAVVGAGGWWARSWHVPGLRKHPEADIAAIVEMDPVVRDELAKEYGCSAFATLDDLLDSDVDVDGVLISTPHRTHFDLGMKAIAAGLNVLIEKPMTTTSEDAQTIVDAATAAGKIFMVNVCQCQFEHHRHSAA